MPEIEVNEPLRPEIRIVGNEKTPVVVIDDLLVSTDALIRHASNSASFGPKVPLAYPGIRADLPAEYTEAVVPELLDVIARVYNPPPAYESQLIHQLYSLVTQPPEALRSLQRVPHFDNHSPYYFATVHYLNPGEHAGTGLFRHRPTGFERIPQERYPAYMRAAESHIRAHGLPPEKYINASDDHFELVEELEYRPNRLVLYPGNILHSGLIQPDRDIDDNPATGRLTANLFLYFADPAAS